MDCHTCNSNFGCFNCTRFNQRCVDGVKQDGTPAYMEPNHFENLRQRYKELPMNSEQPFNDTPFTKETPSTMDAPLDSMKGSPPQQPQKRQVTGRNFTIALLAATSILIWSLWTLFNLSPDALSFIPGTIGCQHKLTVEQRAHKVLKENPLIGVLPSSRDEEPSL